MIQTGRVTASALNLRSQADTSGNPLANLPSGTIVEILRTLVGGTYPFSSATRNDWHEVKVNGQQGFVAAGFVSLVVAPPPPTQIQEIRGVWIVDYAHSPVLKSAENIDNALTFLKANGFNTVFPAIWNRGFTAFPSEVMARHGFPKQDPFYADAGFDPLREIVNQGKAQNMVVIPWFEYGFAASPNPDGGHILQTKPQWSAIDSSGQKVRHGGLTWMNSLAPEVQQFMLDLIKEVIQKYDVDGIQGDDRLPAMPFTGSYDTNTKDKFKAKFGTNPSTNGKDAIWIKFRADLLTQFLEQLFREVKSTKPSCVVSIAPAPFPFGRDNLMQDSNTWVTKGIVDLLHPQLYRTSFTHYKPEIDKIKSSFPNSAQRNKFSPGIAFRANNVNLTTSDIVKSVQLNRRSGLGGQVFFFYEGIAKNDNQMAIALRTQGGYNQIASLPPPFMTT